MRDIYCFKNSIKYFYVTYYMTTIWQHGLKRHCNVIINWIRKFKVVSFINLLSTGVQSHQQSNIIHHEFNKFSISSKSTIITIGDLIPNICFSNEQVIWINRFFRFEMYITEGFFLLHSANLNKSKIVGKI